jgi:T5SS/PEP-CTERM-associated repeat protein/autotransporter-associated beta strand protein
MPASRFSHRLLAALATLGPALGFAQTSGFIDVFAPENWIFSSGGAPASITWDDTFTSFTLGGSNTGSGNPSYTLLTVTLTEAYRVSFDWSYSTDDLPSYDPAGYTSGSYAQLTDSSGPRFQSGSTLTSPVYFAVGTAGFYVYSLDNTYGAARLTISNFSFSLAGADDSGPPPPSSWPYTASSAVSITDGSSRTLSTAGAARSVYIDNNSSITIADGGVLTLAASDSYFTADYGASLTVTGAGSALNNTGGFTLYTATALVDQGATVSSSYVYLAGFDDNIATLTLRNGASWSTDDLTVGANGQATVNIESGATLSATYAVIGYSGSAQSTINVTGAGSTLDTGHLKVAEFGVGTLNISGGAQVSSASADIAYGSAGGAGITTGKVNVTGAGSRWTIAANHLGIGNYSSASYYSFGTLTIADGGTVRVGSTGTGTVRIDRNGTLEIGTGGLAGTLQAGAVSFVPTSGSAALLAFNHSDDLVFSTPISGRGRVTKAGAGTLTLSGNNSYTQGTTVTGGTLRATSSANALGGGASTLTLAGGHLALANNSGLNFARNTTLAAHATITSDRGSTNGAGVTHTLGTLSLGAHTLSLAAGPRVASGTAGLTFGATTLSANGATFDTAAGTLLTLGALSGDFTFTKAGAGQLTLATASTRSGATTTLSGGTLRLANANALGTAQRTLNLEGGTLHLAANTGSTFNGTNVVLRGDATIVSDRGSTNGAGVAHTLGTLSLGSHTLTATRGALATSGNAGLVFGATTLAGSPTISVGTGAALTLGAVGETGGARGLTKAGAGRLTLSAAGDYTGGTSVDGGTLVAGHVAAFGTGPITVRTGATLDLGGFAVANALDVRGGALLGLGNYAGTQTLTGPASYSGTVAGALTVASGGTLHTTGATFTGPITIQSGGALTGTGTLASVTIGSGGTLSPGNSPGLLTINGDLTLAGGSTTLIEINGLARGANPGHDAIDIFGAFTAGGTLQVVFIDGFTPTAPASFDLFNFASIGGSFAQVDLPAVSGHVWNTSSLLIDGRLELLASPIPEPASFAALAGLAALGATATRRRRHVRGR